MLKPISPDSSIFYIGVDDTTIDLFENQYPVPHGVSYNAYAIRDEKTALLDTVDPRATEQWLEQAAEVLDGTAPDYLVISHMEPDHAGSIQALAERYPEMTLVGSAKALAMLPQFFRNLPRNPTLAVKEGDVLELGTHTLHFVMAPMVHWPEVMVSYESAEKVLFSADAFGKFGALCTDEPWTDEARRYFLNIVGKYGTPVQTLLKKAAKLDIQTICPLHGPVLTGDLAPYLHLYQTWSSYTPEEKGVLVAHASIHGNTAKAAAYLAEQLKALGEKVTVIDLCRCDMAEAVAQAFRYDRMVLAASSYDGGVSNAALVYYFGTKDAIVIEATAHCMAKVEDDFMAQAPTSFRDIERFLREMPYLTAKLHGAKYRFMYQVYASPKYREHGKAFFSGVNVRYRKYAEQLSPKLGLPVELVQGMTYLFVRACVHYALFEDEEYLQLQLNAIRASLRAIAGTGREKEETR